MLLTEKDKGVLLLAARESIQFLFAESFPPAIDYSMYPNLEASLGAFVTLHKNNELRGCIGYVQSEMKLFETICESAKKAAVEDPRFPPVQQDEIPFLEIEISVLSHPKPIGSINEIEIGKHGLLLDDHIYRAVLLPQVAAEQKYSVEEFISALCDKAGLDLYSFKKKRLNLKVFTADVFSEFERRKTNYEHV